MAFLLETDVRPDNEIRAAVDESINYARQQWAPLNFEGEYPMSGFGITILRPRHVGQPNDYWQYSVTTSFANWVTDTLSDNVVDVITGIFNLTPDPSTTEVFPSANGIDLPYFNMEHLYATNVQRAWFTKPWAVKNNNSVTIQTIGRVGQVERLGLMGFAIAKRSYLLTAAP